MIDWPDWLSEARLALIISGLSATFTGLNWLHTWRIARNDSKRMKRKPPVFEAEMDRTAAPDGWRAMLVTIRNLESISADINHVSAKSRRHYVIRRDDAYEKPARGWEEPKLLDVIPEKRRAEIGIRVAPVGTPPHPDRIRPAAVEHVWLFCKGVTDIRDLDFRWAWSDGKAS